MRIIAVFHQDKVEGLEGLPREIQANPPMTIEGMKKIRGVISLMPQPLLVGVVAIFTSIMARAMDAASMFGLRLGHRVFVLDSLGQHGNKDRDGSIYMYPNYEDETYTTWQQMGLSSLREISDRQGGKENERSVIIISHRPIIGGLIAHTQDTHDEAGIKKVVNDPSIMEGGYRVFDYDVVTDKLSFVS